MPEPLSHRGKILKNLIRQLETIKVANGYSHDITTVTASVRGWSEYVEAQCPALFVIDESTNYEYHATKTMECSWDVSIFGVIRGKDQLFMEEVIADCEDAIARNVTLSFDGVQPGPVSHIRIKNITSDGALFDIVENSQLFRILLTIKYKRCFDQPR